MMIINYLIFVIFPRIPIQLNAFSNYTNDTQENATFKGFNSYSILKFGCCGVGNYKKSSLIIVMQFLKVPDL